MKERKLIFFDIDGTLLKHNGELPESAARAMTQAREGGHMLFVATGRSRIELPWEISRLNFDGWILGSGAYVETQGKVLFHEVFDQDKMVMLVELLEKNGAHILYETNDACYVTPEAKDYVMGILSENELYKEISKVFIESIHVVEDRKRIRDVNKMVYYDMKGSIEDLMEEFREDFTFLPNSILIGEELSSGEISKKGITKARGMEYILSYYGYGRESTIAFGDGFNDMEMIKYAGTGIAMGNGVAELKEAADETAPPVEENGIYRMLHRLKVI